MSNTQHTPTPWEWWECGSEFMLSSVGHGKLIVLQASPYGMSGAALRVRDHKTCVMHKITNEDAAHPDLQFILRACNSHEDLLAACRDLMDAFWDMSPLEYAADRGLPCMSDAEGERIKVRAREAISKSEVLKT